MGVRLRMWRGGRLGEQEVEWGGDEGMGRRGGERAGGWRVQNAGVEGRKGLRCEFAPGLQHDCVCTPSSRSFNPCLASLLSRPHLLHPPQTLPPLSVFPPSERIVVVLVERDVAIARNKDIQLRIRLLEHVQHAFIFGDAAWYGNVSGEEENIR